GTCCAAARIAFMTLRGDRGLLALAGKALRGGIHIHHEAVMLAAADRVDAVAPGHLEGDGAAFHLHYAHRDLDGHAEQCRREMIELHAGADRILSRIEMSEK